MAEDIYSSALNACQLQRYDVPQLFCLLSALQGWTGSSWKFIEDWCTISESCPHSIFSAVGPLLTVRTRIHQNVSRVADLFVGDHHRGQPFNQASVIDCRRNYHAIPHLRTCAPCKKHTLLKHLPKHGTERMRAVKAVQERTSSPCRWLSDKCHMQR